MAQKKKKKNRYRKYFVVGVLAFLLLAVAIYVNRTPAPAVNEKSNDSTDASTIHAVFVCPDESNIEVTFNEDTAYVKLPDGSSYEMHATPSAGGARYENGDGSLVLWNTGNTVSVDEGGATLYSDCVTNS